MGIDRCVASGQGKESGLDERCEHELRGERGSPSPATRTGFLERKLIPKRTNWARRRARGNPRDGLRLRLRLCYIIAHPVPSPPMKIQRSRYINQPRTALPPTPLLVLPVPPPPVLRRRHPRALAPQCRHTPSSTSNYPPRTSATRASTTGYPPNTDSPSPIQTKVTSPVANQLSYRTISTTTLSSLSHDISPAQTSQRKPPVPPIRGLKRRSPAHVTRLYPRTASTVAPILKTRNATKPSRCSCTR